MPLSPSPLPFDLMTDVSELLAWCGLELETVQGASSAAQVEATAQELAQSFAGLSREQAAGYVRACVIGYLLALARSARTTEQWRSQILAFVGQAHEDGTIDPGVYGALLAQCTNPDNCLVVPESAWPSH